MNKYLLIGVVAILIVAGGWLYLNQSNVPVTQLPVEQQDVNTSPATTQTQPTAGAATKTYTNSEVGISFSYPSTWHCKAMPGNDGFFACYDNEAHGTFGGNSMVIVGVRTDRPMIESNTGGDTTTINQTTIAGPDSSEIDLFEQQSTIAPNIGFVVYRGGPIVQKWFVVNASYGAGKPYATAAEAKAVLTPIAQSVLIK